MGRWTQSGSLDVEIRAQQRREEGVQSDQAFVAMRFSSELEPAYDLGIAPGLREAGYRPLRIDRVPHNGTIDDRIIAEIRRSVFVVADLTEHAAGVYFEAGFALGRSIEVIWCCRHDHLAATHFDVKQYNIIYGVPSPGRNVPKRAGTASPRFRPFFVVSVRRFLYERIIFS
jgi:hypothetical protein